MSGGGLRAAVFHFGILARLASENLLEDIDFISTVSGGSLGMGLIFANSEGRFPSSEEYLQTTLPRLKQTLTTIDLRRRFILKTFTSPRRMCRRRANDFAQLLEKHWKINFNLDQLPDKPRWIINATCHQTGSNWRFMKKRMGDTKFGYVFDPVFLISNAIAASAALPGFVGPYVLNTRNLNWQKYINGDETKQIEPEFKKIHLFDGALYDNLGIEALMKRPKSEINFLIVSNAGIKLSKQKYGFGLNCYLRIKDILQSRSTSLYTRHFFSNYLNLEGKLDNTKGRYLQFGSCAEYILRQAESLDVMKNLSRVLSNKELKTISQIDLKKLKLTSLEFDILFFHGYEVANCTLHGYTPNYFELLPNFPSI